MRTNELKRRLYACGWTTTQIEVNIDKNRAMLEAYVERVDPKGELGLTSKNLLKVLEALKKDGEC